ncbi:MAG: 2,3-bisphosphoglycerate-independent phosphoglycerate mutase, partial [Planctomycetota bacterium]
IEKKLKEVGGIALVTADHGNSEEMWDYESNQPHTAHTTNPVPVFLIGKGIEKYKLRNGGRLADVAPTLLQLLGIKPSEPMTGKTLIK